MKYYPWNIHLLKNEWSELWEADEQLFAEMEGNYVSENERQFFKIQMYKQMYLPTSMNDLVIHETMNDDHIYLVRIASSEYELGHGIGDKYDEYYHTMCLADVLKANLKELGYIDRDLTLLEWLRERDYKGVMYDHNYDDYQ